MYCSITEKTVRKSFFIIMISIYRNNLSYRKVRGLSPNKDNKPCPVRKHKVFPHWRAVATKATPSQLDSATLHFAGGLSPNKIISHAILQAESIHSPAGYIMEGCRPISLKNKKCSLKNKFFIPHFLFFRLTRLVA